MFRLVLRREPDQRRGERALAKLADGTLSRATLVHELDSAARNPSACAQLDDAVVLGLGARQRRERIRWLQAPPATDERVVEIPWVLSRLAARVACSRSATRSQSLPISQGFSVPGVELVGVDLADA